MKAESRYGLRNIRILCVNAMMSPCDGLWNTQFVRECNAKNNAGSNLSWVHLLASKENKFGPVRDAGNHKHSSNRPLKGLMNTMLSPLDGLRNKSMKSSIKLDIC